MDDIKNELKALEGAISEKAEKRFNEFTEKFEAVTKKLEKAEADKEVMQKHLNELSAKATDIAVGAQRAKSFGQNLEEGLGKKADSLAKFKQGEGKGFALEIKAVGNMGSTASLTGDYLVPATVVPGVLPKMYEEVHMRSLLPVGSTTSNTIRYIQDNGGEGGPAMVAEAGTKPQMDRDLEIKDAPVRKMATYFRVPEEMIEDIPYLSSFLSQVGIEEVNIVEDAQILYGDGTGQNLTGFDTAGTAFAAGTSVVATPNEFDVIGAAKKQLRVSKFGGSLVALISPVDYYNLRYKRKDADGNYIFQSNQGVPLGINVDGVQIIEHTAVTDGDFFVFSPRAAAIFDRAGTSVRFYDQDQDNAIKNLITIVIEKRLALPIYYPGAIITGTFSAAITDLTS
jgi:HK97 family phage major capsid protein